VSQHDKLNCVTVLKSKNFVLKASPGVEGWLFDNDVTIGFSTYQTGKLFFVGLDPEKKSLSVFERNFSRCMGLCVNREGSLFVSTLYQLWRLNNIVDLGESFNGREKVYVPQVAFTTGAVSAHDIGSQNGQPIFVNTLFNCLATVSETHSFKMAWKPEFISEIVPEDRCHLNGLGMRSGKPYVVSAVSRSNHKNRWRQERQRGGVVIDVASNEVLAEGLSMPHSPRYHNNKIWLLNSGTGELGYLEKGNFIPITFCPGFLRGLSFVGDYAIVGLSLPRTSSTFQDLVLDSRLSSVGGGQCGVQIIDIRSGKTVHSLLIDGVVKELYDVITIPGSICPLLVGFETDEIERMINIQR
jgi:uncharacterized protein (TIGR03032 family)